MNKGLFPFRGRDADLELEVSWQPLRFLLADGGSNWVEYANIGAMNTAYMRDRYGWVHVVGEIDSGATGIVLVNTTLWTFPPSFRPHVGDTLGGTAPGRYYCKVFGSTGLPRSLYVQRDGQVKLGEAWASTEIGSLHGIHFPTFRVPGSLSV